MDPLSISASAVALITVCVQTVQIIKKTIETIKTAKRELLNVLNETNRMRLLLEQLRALTHQLGSKNNKILLAFDQTGCEEILSELKRLIDKLAQAELFAGFQFLVRRSKLEALVAGLRAQEDGIRTVLLSVATESAVFTRDYVQTLIDGANVQAVSISSITQSSTGVVDEPPPPFTEHAEPPSPTDELDLAKMKLTSEGQAQMDIPGTEDIISLAETDLPSTSIADHPAELGTNVGFWSPLKEDDSTLWLPISTSNPLETQKQIDATPAIPPLTKLLSETVIWHGQLSRYMYDDEYLRLRDRLADAAYYGDWDEVEATIDDAHEHGLRSWPNCYRIGKLRGPSGWTPLHQAAFLGAPKSAVRMLVDQGASRTLQTVRTSSSELPFRNMTALEMAQFLGFKYLFDVLSPIIHYSIPCATLHKLQQNFHYLIRGDLAGRPEDAQLRLPELELLTELENPEMYFPLKSPKIAMGYFYRLDGRELLVMSLGISSSGQRKYYRVTERGAREIQDAILFDMS
ncbi:hypothetical protein GJ744_009026 [Endocarpon pusillum]|uniref:Azaphilone pigments biosynthesis cluster protein L N-terminal domain-containing protein n=1 Tax=Endocarpon pusillum TaxID=364733 RepID=A0A8H7AI99_9EURO|nr:hypothetical protein GJ744_009026 [Endocarpon pusillum]